MTQQLHLKAPMNWINDPNGFIYYRGKYHLFYQHYPHGPRWGTMHWGHAVSDDLVSWEHVGIALHPSVPEDLDGCFSGSAVENDGKMVLFYTGVRLDEPEEAVDSFTGLFTASQMSITSEDGFHFDNETGKQVVIPSIRDPRVGDRTHTRDPKVWRGKDAWYMILGSTTPNEGGKLLIYRSEDLRQWTLQSETSMQNRLGWMWECPDYFRVGEDHVLVFSPMGLLKDGKIHDSQAICMNAGFDEESCRLDLPEEYSFLDYGLDLYAPQSTIDKEGNRILVGWMRMPEAVNQVWNGMFCMPRVVEVRDGHICFRLHPALKAAFSKEISSPEEASRSGYSLHLSLNEGEEIDVGGYRVRRENGCIATDRSKVFPDREDLRRTFRTPPLQEGDHLDIYVEPHLVEIFVNDGEYVLSNIVYGMSKEITFSEGVSYTMKTLNS